MNKELKKCFIGLGVLLLYLFWEYSASFWLLLFKINKLNIISKVIFSLIYELILILIIIYIYRHDLNKYLKNIKSCKFTNYIKYWFISIGLMSISTILIEMFTSINTSTNQEIIIETFKKVPIYTAITTILYAPILEELVFRLSFRKMFKTNILFIIMSGIFFGFMHVSNPSSLLELVYIIPYSIPGFIFAYTLVKSDNIFIPMGLHCIHNSVMIIIQIISLLN